MSGLSNGLVIGARPMDEGSRFCILTAGLSVLFFEPPIADLHDGWYGR